jgi:hypothetical protein
MINIPTDADLILIDRMAASFTRYDLTDRFRLLQVAMNAGFTRQEFERLGFDAVEKAAQTRRRATPHLISEAFAKSATADHTLGVIAVCLCASLAGVFHYALPLVWSVLV